jgi:murein DD-endopeptidase MepM/ murein hydrolase activator NlpD
MSSQFINFCLTGRCMHPLWPALLICVLLQPNIPFAQQLHVSSPLPQLHITSPYGKRIHPILGIPKFHYGVDFKCRSDTIKSILEGEVIAATYDRKLGNYITIKTGDLEIIYAHLNGFHVQFRDFVWAGDNIGISGKSGLATAEHLHLAVKINGRFINPIIFLKALQTQLFNTSKND